jgi:hypothetical protein
MLLLLCYALLWDASCPTFLGAMRPNLSGDACPYFTVAVGPRGGDLCTALAITKRGRISPSHADDLCLLFLAKPSAQARLMSELVGVVDENKTPEKTKEEPSEFRADVPNFETEFYLDEENKPRTVQLDKSKGFGGDPGSIRNWLEGKANEKNGMRISRLLSKIGVTGESDLDDLGEGPFESTPDDAKPIVVLLLWRVSRQHALLPPLYRVQEPSLKKTTLGLKMPSTDAACFNETPDFMKKNLTHPGSGGLDFDAKVNAGPSLPTLPENERGRDDDLPPPTPGYQRVNPATRRGRQSTGPIADLDPHPGPF